MVYDKQHYFARFLKYEFNKKFNFQKFKKDENLEDIEKKFSIVVFVVYSEADLFDFVEVYKMGVQILVCTYNKEILNKMKNVSNIILFDISTTKLEMVKELRHFFYRTTSPHKQIQNSKNINNLKQSI
ncbi:hypothetical protein ACM55H_03545 [Flavobacterium sp. ZT3R17]|uniref:hypothetical protein n=1 Tax=Flavobacterium cryoconiti TaxID=3398736 RepID=UPI003A89C52E